jgi:hypothetical protein
MSVKFLAQGNNDLPLTGFLPMWLAIIRLLNHSAMLPHFRQKLKARQSRYTLKYESVVVALT